MTHSNSPEANASSDEVDLDADMDAFDLPPDIEDSVAIEKKSDKEIQIDHLEQLLSYSKINSWERGFCTSCLTWLQSKPDAQLSYKQKDVLGKTVSKYFD